MDEQSQQSVNLRKLQEQMANLITGELHNEIAKWHKAIYDAYIKIGFTSEQAIDLIKANINSRGI